MSSAALLAQYKPSANLALAGTLPAAWYFDADMLQLEREKIFWRSWQPVAGSAALRRHGDFVTCDVQGKPLVITRDAAGSLCAFYNVCRHRAGPVAAGKGNRKTLQCRYHGWTYGLDGQLLAAPEFEGVGDWAVDQVCLPAVKVAEWGPWVFVNLDPQSESVETSQGPIWKEVAAAGFDVSKLELLERREYIVEANWKVYIDNYLEGYHIPIAHPGLFRELDYEQYRVETFRNYSKQHAPFRAAGAAAQAGHDRRYVRGAGEPDALYYWLFPNVMFNFYPDNLQINIVLPLDAQRTLTVFEWYFAQPGTGAGWESMQQSIAFSDEVQREDMEICRAVQLGLQSGVYERGRFSVKRENGVHHFQQLVHAHLTS